jgi:2-polyprenyl-3-methyl-5-hydroxy-6-metoxy-1,4-benzoquinol methylase
VLKRTIHALGRAYIRKIINDEADAQSFRHVNERPIELRFLFDCITRFQPETVLDVGTGTSPLPAMIENCGCHVRAIDNVRDYWPEGMQNRHWRVENADIRDGQIGPQRFHMVTCISVLEHIDAPEKAMVSMARLLRQDGLLVLTTPYSENHPHPNVYAITETKPPPYICRSTSRQDLTSWLRQAGLEIVEQEYWQLYTGEMWRVGEPLDRPVQATAETPHQLTCLLLRRPAL